MQYHTTMEIHGITQPVTVTVTIKPQPLVLLAEMKAVSVNALLVRRAGSGIPTRKNFDDHID